MNNGNTATRAAAFNGNVLPGAVKALLLAIVLGILPVHSASLQEQAETAAVADGVSTLGGLALGAAEANPLGLAVFPLKALYMSHIKTMPEDEQAEAYAGVVWRYCEQSLHRWCNSDRRGTRPLLPDHRSRLGHERAWQERSRTRAVGHLPRRASVLEESCHDVRLLQEATRLRAVSPEGSPAHDLSAQRRANHMKASLCGLRTATQ
jgi:hypothetical protein